MAVIDANIVLRYILNDHEELSAKATDIIENRSVTLPMEAACEVVYVLQKVYKVERKQIQQHLSELVNEDWITVCRCIPYSHCPVITAGDDTASIGTKYHRCDPACIAVE